MKQSQKMTKEDVLILLAKTNLLFIESPTKGLVFYENILLPKDDKGVNEKGYLNLRAAFLNSSDEQKDLVENAILIFQMLRKACLENAETKEFMSKECDEIRESVADNMIRLRGE